MKTLVHKNTDVSINVFKFDENIVEACFFKDKPKVNDYFMSHTRCETNFLYLYRIVDILENRDSKGHNSHFNGEKAYFKLKVEMLNDINNGLSLPEEYSHINTSRRDNY